MKRRLLSVLLTVAMVLSLVPVSVLAAGNHPFRDVPSGHWADKAVEYVYEQGMMNGTGKDTFSPNDTTTRAMIVTILHRMEGTPAATGESFTDVSAGQYYTAAVAWASANQVVNGYGGGLFGPNNPITREQMAAILYRYAQYKGYDVSAGVGTDLRSYKDYGKLSSWAEDAMKWACGAGLISGMGDGTLAPGGKATRAQVATILMRFCENIAVGGGDVTITIDTGDYEDTVVNRTVTVRVTGGEIDVVQYQLTKASRTEEGYLAQGGGGTFQVDVLLDDGANTFSVVVTTTDGRELESSAKMMYESGEIYDTEDERLIQTPVRCGEDGEVQEYMVANVLNLYFREDISFADREVFVEDVLGGEVIGALNTLDLVQVLLPDELINAEEIGYTGTTSLIEITWEDLYEYKQSLDAYYEELEYVGIESVYTDSVLQYATNDPWNGGGNDDWWMRKIDAYGAWEEGEGYFTNITVAAVDSGFRSGHEDLSGKVQVRSEVDNASDHGTHVAGIMVAKPDNGKGLAGIMNGYGHMLGYDVKDSASLDKIYDSDLKSSLQSAVKSGAKVINYSIGASESLKPGQYEWTGKDVIKYNDEATEYSKVLANLLKKGYDFIVVQSAGNGNEDGVGVHYWNNTMFCAITDENCYHDNKISKQEIMDRILVVAALQSDGMLSEFSNGGEGDLNIIAAPGSYIFSTIAGDTYVDEETGKEYENYNAYYEEKGWSDWVAKNQENYGYKSGTSMAAPVVSAVCGLVWSVNTGLTGAEVVEIVMNTTQGTAKTNASSQAVGGMGIVNARNAIAVAIEVLESYYGTVVDMRTGKPIPSASIEIYNGLFANGTPLSQPGTLATRQDGTFKLPKLPVGLYTMKVSADGYYDTVWRFGLLWKLTEGNLGYIKMIPKSGSAGNPGEAVELSLGSYVQFGSLEGLPLKWQVINTEGGNTMLFLDKVLFEGVFDGSLNWYVTNNLTTYRGYGSGDWEHSDLRQYLNGESGSVAYTDQVYDYSDLPKLMVSLPANDNKSPGYAKRPGFLSSTNFSAEELALIQPVTHDYLISYTHPKADKSSPYPRIQNTFKTWEGVKEYYSQCQFTSVTDKVFPLSSLELATYVVDNNLSYEVDPFDKYWLRDSIVQELGSYTIYCGTYAMAVGGGSPSSQVMNGKAGVRPACVVAITEEDILSGSGTYEDPYVLVRQQEYPIHGYKVFNGVANTWEEAEAYCKSVGGHLATLNTKVENDYVYQLVRDAGYTSAYFGLSDRNKEGTWTWVNGEKVGYTNWHSSEPSGSSDKEDYAMFYYKYEDGTWNDGDFGGKTENGGKAFICEWDTKEAYDKYMSGT